VSVDAAGGRSAGVAGHGGPARSRVVGEPRRADDLLLPATGPLPLGFLEGPRPSTARLLPALVLAGWVLLLAAWVMGNAPFAAPDEADHFIRAVGVGAGHPIGAADPAARLGATSVQLAWTAQSIRLVSLPRGLDPRPFSCELGLGEHSAACLNSVRSLPSPVSLVSAVGNYQPLPYLLPAFALRAGGSAPAALRFARAAQALTVLALLALAVFALYDAAAPLVSLLGLLLAATPMVLFCAASLSGSGLEISGAVAFFSCLLRLGWPGRPPARWWVFTALSGAVLALSRSTGPAWLVLLGLIMAAWSGPRAFAGRWTAGRAGRVAAGVLVVAVALNRVWEGLYGSHLPLDTSRLSAGLVAGAHEWWRALPDLVGKFGYLDVKLPLVLPLVWFALVLSLLAAAWAVCGRRERLVFAGLLAGALGGPVVFYALFLRPTGFGLQGRHVLPVLVAIPLLAGETLYRRSRSLSRVAAGRLALLAAVVPVAVALVQVAAWYVNARRYAVGGSGLVWFLDRAAWAPPGGWWTWLAAAVLGGLCLGAGAFAGRGAINLGRNAAESN
jgi:Predicted membrane protein (DUF2142)